jgi:hypothetical protein
MTDSRWELTMALLGSATVFLSGLAPRGTTSGLAAKRRWCHNRNQSQHLATPAHLLLLALLGHHFGFVQIR